MRIVYATDLHGSKAQYQQLLALALRQDARAVILGGDLLPIDGPFAESIQAQDHFIRTFLGPTLLDFSRAHPHIGLYWLHGNNDWAASLPALHQAMTAAGGQCLHNRIHTLENGYQLIGYANVPPTPFRIKDHERLDHDAGQFVPMSRPAYVSSGSEMIPVEQDLHFSRHLSIREELTSLPIPKHPDKTVYVMHSPPRDSTLDRMFNGKSAGSAAIREFIEERRPYLALHGHIHEAPEKSGRYADWIDRTLCVNPGHHPDHLFAVWLDLEEAPGTIRHSHFDPEG